MVGNLFLWAYHDTVLFNFRRKYVVYIAFFFCLAVALVCFFFACFLLVGAAIYWELFLFLIWLRTKDNYLRCLHLLSCLSLGRGVVVRPRSTSSVVWQWCLVLFVWPHGRVDRLSSVSGTSALCHELA